MRISINGVDDVGKSQQIRLLKLYSDGVLSFAKPLNKYSEKWPKLNGTAMFNWWFKDGVDINEFFSIVLESLNMRHLAFLDSEVVIYDRGSLMFKAVCVATLSIRKGMDLQDSVGVVDSFFAKHLDYKTEQEHAILLQPDILYQKSIAPYLLLLQSESSKFTDEENEVYARYQYLLTNAMSHYFNNQNCAQIIVDSSICDIQNKLRSRINDVAELSLPKICSWIKKIISFGGLSESGKSSFADHMRQNGYSRLKLGYFVDMVKKRGQRDTPENVALEFLYFCKIHYYLDRFTLESLHEPYTPAFLKLMFGDTFKIVYIDAPFEVRARRASVELGVSLPEAETQTMEKDYLKKSRGAEIVKDIADIVFNNSEDDHVGNVLKFQTMT